MQTSEIKVNNSSQKKKQFNFSFKETHTGKLIHKPRVAFGANSAIITGTVELTAPSPKPVTILATIIWAPVYAVDCRRDPMIIMTTSMAIVFLLPSRCPAIAVAILPRKAPTSMIETIRLIMTESGELKVSLKAVWLTSPPINPLSYLLRVISF